MRSISKSLKACPLRHCAGNDLVSTLSLAPRLPFFTPRSPPSRGAVGDHFIVPHTPFRKSLRFGIALTNALGYHLSLAPLLL